MTDSSIIASALAAYRPAIAEQYIRIVRHHFNKMVIDHGPNLAGVVNSWTHARTYTGLVRQFIRRADGDVILDDFRLAQAAAAYAEAATVEWQSKIISKVGDLTDAEVIHLDGHNFEITGTRQGRKVKITQSIILNVSSKGLPFNQFPARIYVDGKSTSASAYAKLFS